MESLVSDTKEKILPNYHFPLNNLDWQSNLTVEPSYLNIKNPKKIAIDITGVLADPWPLIGDMTEDKWGFRYEKEYAYEWYGGVHCLYHLFGKELTIEEYKQIFRDVWNQWEDIPLTEPYVRELWKDLNQLKLDISIVTCASQEKVLKGKTNWIQKNFSNLVPVINSHGKEKYDMPFDILIDDQPHSIAGATIRGMLGIVYTQPYNLGLTKWMFSFRADRLLDAVMFLDGWLR